MSKQPNLLDLPDEILLMIFKQLKTIDVLYLIANVNQRLNSIAHDYFLTRELDLTALSTIKDRCNERVTDEQVLSHLRQNILSRIHHQIHRLTLEPSSMKDMIAVANYPQLYSLTLRNFQEENLHQYFAGMFVKILQSFSSRIFSFSSSTMKMIGFNSVFANNFDIFISMSKRRKCGPMTRFFRRHLHRFCPNAIN